MPATIVKQRQIPKKLLETIIQEDKRRVTLLFAKYDPLTGENAPGKRFVVQLSDFFNGRKLFLPVRMLQSKFIIALMKAGSIHAYVEKHLPDMNYDRAREAVIRRYCRIRCKHDFYFFAGAYARIKNKDGGPDIPFYLRKAQIKLVELFESLRLSDSPIFVILLKCRQWGGSTATDIYMAWIMIFHRTHWNANICGHQSSSATNVFNMYEKLINAIPLWLFYNIGEEYPEDVKKFKNDSKNPNIKYLVPRQCMIQTGSALNPEAARSSDVAMAHITEEAFFPNTEKWTPALVVKSVLSPIDPLPYRFIVRESTPNGRENEFHDEWVRAKSKDKDGKPLSNFKALFVAWFEIERYFTPLSEDERINYIIELWQNREDEAGIGAYLWHLYQIGASIEGIKWYETKARTYPAFPSLDDMQQEYPSDDIEAFKYSGKAVFDIYKVEALREDCENPQFIGDIEGDTYDATMKECMQNLRLVQKSGGELRVWDMPDDTEDVMHRYLVSCDIGGSHSTSDYSDIVVIDRYDCMYGGVPAIVAEWHGHCPPDQLAMKCAQIAKFYFDAFLVVENNTAYSKMNNTDGNISDLFFPILVPLYDNLYNSNHSKALKRRPKEVMWGFNTNESTKPSLVHTLAAVIRQRQYMEREEEALNEYTYYMQYPNGRYGNVPGKHDDRVMARAIGFYVHREMPTPVIIPRKTASELARERLERNRPKVVRYENS